jgi:hypothetical protein
MDIDNICIALQRCNNKFEDQIEFFKTNYNKIFMTMGDKENKLYYDSLEELKIDVEWFCVNMFTFKFLNFFIIILYITII